MKEKNQDIIKHIMNKPVRIYKMGVYWSLFDEKARKQYEMDPMSLLGVDTEEADFITQRFTRFLSGYVDDNGLDGYVIGLSGGIDSSLAAKLAVEAVGSERVYGMLLPSRFTSYEHIDDALLVADELNIEVNDYHVVKENFDSIAEGTLKMAGIKKANPKYDVLLANAHARERMKILRAAAQCMNYLVLGTTNLTETWLGYATIAGDGYKGIDIEPIQRLPKTSERLYSGIIGIPQRIISKAPTAGLWEGQTDEDELGTSYENMDRIMVGHMLGFSVDDIVGINSRTGITKKVVESLISLSKRNEFKAKPEPFADLSIY